MSAILSVIVTQAMAAEYLEVTKISTVSNGTVLEMKRYSTTNTLFTFVKKYNTVLTPQEAVDKAAAISDNGVTAMTKLASTTPKNGMQGEFAQLRSDAYKTKGLVGYFAELARQFTLEN